MDKTPLGAIVNLITGGLGAPKTPEVKTAPTPDDEAIRRARARELERQGQKGRASTVLTGPGSASKLG